MNKKWTRILIAAIVFLIVCIGVVSYLFNSKLNKEVKTVKNFLQVLYDNNMVETKVKIDDIDFQISKHSDGGKKYYRVTSKMYGFDLDTDYNVIAFNNYYDVTTINGVSITENESLLLAEKYIAEIVSDDYKYKERIVDGNDTLSYYGYIFTKYKDGYPYYSDQIMIQIDKYSGYLTAYTNSSTQNEPEKANVNIKIDGAEAIAIEAFNNSSNKEGIINNDSVYIAYCDNSEKTLTKLCYVVVVKGLDINNKDVKWKYFITTDTGELLNSIKDTVSETSVEH